MKSKPKKKKEIKVRYYYVKPKNEEEAKEQERKVSKAFDILFEETERRMAHNNQEETNTTL